MFFSLVERLPIVSMDHKCVVLCFELLCASISRVWDILQGEHLTDIFADMWCFIPRDEQRSVFIRFPQHCKRNLMVASSFAEWSNNTRCGLYRHRMWMILNESSATHNKTIYDYLDLKDHVKDNGNIIFGGFLFPFSVTKWEISNSVLTSVTLQDHKLQRNQKETKDGRKLIYCTSHFNKQLFPNETQMNILTII